MIYLFSHYGKPINTLLTYHTVYTLRLPPPYDTKCLYYKSIGYTRRRDCFKRCIVAKYIEKYGKIPFREVIDEPMDYNVVQSVETKDMNASKALTSIESACNRQYCSRLDCKTRIFITNNVFFNAERFRVTIQVPREPSFDVTYHANISLLEFTIFILSSLGSWFGFSVLGCFLLCTKYLIKLIRKKSIKLSVG